MWPDPHGEERGNAVSDHEAGIEPMMSKRCDRWGNGRAGAPLDKPQGFALDKPQGFAIGRFAAMECRMFARRTIRISGPASA